MSRHDPDPLRGERQCALPDVVTHNYHPEGAFLANLCDLAPADAEHILQRIRDAGRPTIKANYLARRLATEAWLIAEKRRLLGLTRRARPVYFFLGDFADGKDPSRPRSLVMPLSAFPSGALTFTYPDSMASFALGTRDDLRSVRQSYHGRVFALEEISRVVETFGMPGEHCKSDSQRPFDRFIEVQVRDERPILEFLDRLERGSVRDSGRRKIAGSSRS